MIPRREACEHRARHGPGDELGGRGAARPGIESASAPARAVLPALLVGLVAILSYAWTLGFDLVWDDPLLLEWVRSQTRDGGLPGLLSSDFRLKHEMPLGFYRPAVLLSMRLDDLLGGGSPFPFHLSNVLLHGGCSLLVLGLLSSLGCGRGTALAGALLFAVHPVHVESVAFVAGRTDLLAALFVLAAAVLWVRDRTGEATRPAAARALGLTAYALACLSKEVAFPLPVVLATWDLLLPRSGRAPSRRGRWVWGLGALLVLAGVFALRALVAGVVLPAPRPGAEGETPLGERLVHLPRVFVVALRLLLLPWPLNAFYTRDQLAIGAIGLLAGAALFLAWMVLASARFRRAGTLSASWTLLFLLPSLGLIPHGGAPIAERFLYLPSVGIALLVVALEGLAKRPKRAAIALLLAVAAIFLPLTVRRQADWRDEAALFRTMIATSPASVEGYIGLAHVESRAGRHEEAIALLRRALELEPRLDRAFLKLGMEFGALRRYDDAIATLQHAVALSPGYPEAHATLGLSCLLAGRPLEARASLERAVEIRPGYAAAWTTLGKSLLVLSDPGAAAALERALALAPGDAEARHAMVYARLAEGRPDLAREEQRRLAEIDPALAEDAERAIRAGGVR